MCDGALLLLGIAGPKLTSGEAALFRRLQPAGYILFTRNIVTPEQTRALTDDLRDLSGETLSAWENIRCADASASRLRGKLKRLALDFRQLKAMETEWATQDCASPWFETGA
jgi:hypothetical protein